MTCSPPTAIGQRGAESDAVARSGRIGEYAARRFPGQRPQPPILPPQDGFLFLDRDKFHASFAADLSAEQAAFMADSQVPWGVDALGGTISEPAWRNKPSWYLVTTQDLMIPPDSQRTMSQRSGRPSSMSTPATPSTSHSQLRQRRHQAGGGRLDPATETERRSPQ